jgi:hypothetical protein
MQKQNTFPMNPPPELPQKSIRMKSTSLNMFSLKKTSHEKILLVTAINSFLKNW